MQLQQFYCTPHRRYVEIFIASLAFLTSFWMLCFGADRSVLGKSVHPADAPAALFTPAGKLRANAQGSWSSGATGSSLQMLVGADGVPQLASAAVFATPIATLQQQVADVRAILANGSDVYFGGVFSSIGGIQAYGVAKYNLTTGQWTTLGEAGKGNGVNGSVYTMVLSGSDLYVGGAFTRVFNTLTNNVSANCIARWNTTTNTWSALGTGVGTGANGVNGDVFALQIVGNSLYCAGGFLQAYVTATNITDANGIARWNLTDNTWSPLGKGFGATLGVVGKDLAVIGDFLYVGGTFSQVINGDNTALPASSIARWNLLNNAWSVLGAAGANNNGITGHVTALAVSGTDLIVGGQFNEAVNSGSSKVVANNLARWNGASWSVLNGAAGANGNGVNGIVRELLVNGTDLYVTGQFTNAFHNGASVSANRITRWTGQNFTAFGSGTGSTGNGLDNEAFAIRMINGQLLVAGPIATAYNSASNSVTLTGIARWANNTWSALEGAAIKGLTTVSAASFATGEMAAGAIAAAYGTGLANETLPATTRPLPTTLGNTTVRVRDSQNQERLAPLFFVSARQINFQIPAETALGTATITINSADGSTAQGTVNIVGTVPGLFTLTANGIGLAAADVVRVRNGAATYEKVATFDTATRVWTPIPVDLGPTGDRVFLALYGTGIRGRGTTAATATIGGTAATVTFAAAHPSLIGVDQVNVEIPRSLAGRGEVDLVLTLGSKNANTVKVRIK